MQAPPVFVINLPGSDDRLAEISGNLATEGLEFERVEAVDARAIVPEDHPEFDGRAMRRTMGRRMMGAELGCCLSHRKALLRFLDGDADTALILEDDARLTPGTGAVLPKLLDALTGRDWSLVNLGHPSVKMSHRVATLHRDGAAHDLLAAHYAPMGGFALLWSRLGAEDYLHRHPKITAPWDNMLQGWLCRAGGGFALSPPLVGVTDALSEIDAVAAYAATAPRARHGRHWSYPLAKQRRLWRNRAWAAINRARWQG
ncbi:glycosyltransferase family 25 protein [Jannaschia pohangensis]|uniref:glycosyltransferase family 25 protein n=1 Tax=Jannaschia pohangensis TaxID=390807 RepID=UPI0015873623|nr:glycosyltransferase family 25 protein [Jannaschia pohangensis]